MEGIKSFLTFLPNRGDEEGDDHVDTLSSDFYPPYLTDVPVFIFSPHEITLFAAVFFSVFFLLPSLLPMVVFFAAKSVLQMVLKEEGFEDSIAVAGATAAALTSPLVMVKT
ncbi:hypothetical protein LXL04_013414 [Taraxacum kok-saghyz]